MRDVNLIPAPRREAKRRRRLMRLCAASCMAYAAAVVGASMASIAVWPGPSAQDHRDLQEAEQQIQHKQHQLAFTHAQLTAAKLTLDAERRVAGQPDWSILLVLMADKAGEQVVLKSCQVRPLTGDVKLAAAGGASPTVEANGVGRSQLAVSQFVLRLERSGLFSKVALVDTHREGYLTGEAVAFRIEATLSGAVEEKR